jgi:hypothetical protein
MHRDSIFVVAKHRSHRSNGISSLENTPHFPEIKESYCGGRR